MKKTTRRRPTLREAGLLGMRGFDPEAVKIKYRTYLVPAQLPKVPAAFGHFSNKPLGRSEDRTPWGMIGNDRAGCCVLAGAAHEHMLWNAATKKPVPRFTAASILEQYFAHTGGEDLGLDPVSIARWRVSEGLKDADGNVHKIKAFALIDSIDELALATYLYGAAGTAFYLPKGAEISFARSQVWADVNPEPDQARGHYVSAIGRNSRGNWVFSTWGGIQAATPQWVQRYVVGGLAYFSRDYLHASGLSPEAIDEAKLDADLEAISNIT